MEQKQLLNIANKQRDFFVTGITQEIEFRIENLNILKRAIAGNEKEILEALKSDLGKPETEAYCQKLRFRGVGE